MNGIATAAPLIVRPAVRRRTVEAVLVVTLVIAVPVLLYVVQLAPLARLAYPLANFALAAWLYARRSPWYLAHCLLLFCAVSLVRRMVDAQGGFDPASPVLFTPYLCCLFLGFSFFEYWQRRRPLHMGAFMLLLGGALYGGILGAIQGRAIASAVDLLKWSVGPLVAVHLLAHAGNLRELRRILENCLIAATTAMALYGIAQFVSPSAWDAEWMRNVIEIGMDSIGRPEPFAVRVFGTMNSPGAFGAVMLVGIVVALKRPLALALPVLGCLLVALALCQYRTLWAATLLALLMLLFTRPQALRPQNVLAALGLILALSSTALQPEIRTTIMQRADTLAELRSDHSGEERLAQYRILSTGDSMLAGDGFGLSGAVRRFSDLPRTVIDSGLIDTWRSLGFFVGTAYLAAFASLIVRIFGRRPEAAQDLDFDRAVVVATFIQLPMGSVHTGELGFFAWVFLGLALTTLASRKVAA
ncbi:MAG TPA: hypothetical protein VGQ27_08785 [Steroidobacteraceae bacterium]|jgi:hypothetical protein|nr:hypothetical protein [Steroidobacteraceae bacterium]